MITYRAHCIDNKIGWQKTVSDGQIAGTVGMNKPIDAIRIEDVGVQGLGIHGFAHVQDCGWSEGNILNEDIGSTGLGKHIEAIKIGLIGEEAGNYDIWYRCHCANYGWLEWSKNGELNGTVGGNVQVEAVQIQLHSKNEGFSPMVDTDVPYMDLTPQNPPVQNAPNILDVARSHLGYLSYSEDDSFFGRRLVGEMAGNWCCYFSVCCAIDAGLNVPITGYCPTMMDWAQETGRWTGSPQPGDFVLYDWDGNGVPNHIGIVEEVHSSDCVTAIEGNVDKGNGVGVYRVYRDFGILGYVRLT